MSNDQLTAHPFEIAGMGTGPYAWVGLFAFPSPALAEANPSAYQAALQEMPRNLKNGCGSCANCLRAISVVCIVRDGQGNLWGVGSDCVNKTGDKALCDKAKVAVAQRASELRREAADKKREERRQAWLAKVCNAQGETNSQRLERENAERVAAENTEKARRSKVAAILSDCANSMADGRGGFRDSVARDMRNGFVPYGKGRVIALEILSKAAGRINSKAYEAEYDRVVAIFNNAEDILATSI